MSTPRPHDTNNQKGVQVYKIAALLTLMIDVWDKAEDKRGLPSPSSGLDPERWGGPMRKIIRKEAPQLERHRAFRYVSREIVLDRAHLIPAVEYDPRYSLWEIVAQLLEQDTNRPVLGTFYACLQDLEHRSAGSARVGDSRFVVVDSKYPVDRIAEGLRAHRTKTYVSVAERTLTAKLQRRPTPEETAAEVRKMTKRWEFPNNKVYSVVEVIAGLGFYYAHTLEGFPYWRLAKEYLLPEKSKEHVENSKHPLAEQAKRLSRSARDLIRKWGLNVPA